MVEDSTGWYEELLRAFEAARGAGWAVQELLGEGNSAAVFSVETPLGKAALKIYRSEFFSGPNEAAERFRLSLHERLIGHDCESLVRILEIGDLGGSAFVLMEHVPWRSLDVLLGAVPQDAIPKIISDVARAAEWLHSRGLVHRDIKPANILVAPDFSAAKLVDLGVVRDTDDTAPDLTDQGKRRPFVATAQYSSPEYLFRLVEPSERLWLGLSIYQVGAVLHDLLSGKPLFQDEVQCENRYVLAMAVLRKVPSLKIGQAPSRWGALAKRALSKDLDARLSSVSLFDFFSLERFDFEVARRQLGLGVAEEEGVLATIAHQRERERLLLKQIAATLRAALDAKLRAEGYKRIQWGDQDEASVWIRVPVPADERKNLELRLMLNIQESVVRVTEGAALADASQPWACDPVRLLWIGALESFSAELSVELLPLASEVVLKRLFEAQNLVALELTSLPEPLGGVNG